MLHMIVRLRLMTDDKYAIVWRLKYLQWPDPKFKLFKSLPLIEVKLKYMSLIHVVFREGKPPAREGSCTAMHHHQFIMPLQVSLRVKPPTMYFIGLQVIQDTLIICEVCLHVLTKPLFKFLVLLLISFFEEPGMYSLINPVSL